MLTGIKTSNQFLTVVATIDQTVRTVTPIKPNTLETFMRFWIKTMACWWFFTCFYTGNNIPLLAQTWNIALLLFSEFCASEFRKFVTLKLVKWTVVRIALQKEGKDKIFVLEVS